MNEDEIKKLDFEYLLEIIKSDELRLETEDSLLEFINSKYLENSEYYYLYEYVNFNNVSNESFEKFSELFDVSDITNKIWKSVIKRCLKLYSNNKNNDMLERYIKKGSKLLYISGHEFEGIIKYLTDKNGGNMHDNGTIEVTYNKCVWHPKNLLDFNESNAYQASGTDCWICFDFKKRTIKMTSYSIKSYKDGPNIIAI